MEQLIMRWINDNNDPIMPEFPKDVTVKNWNDVDNPIDKWVDINGLSEDKENEILYQECNYCYDGYKPEDCYFFCMNGKEVGTITIISNPTTNEGYIHMVSVKPEVRGIGIGNLISLFGVYILKKRNAPTAYLTTDDWRIPAIKSYLKSGFFADIDSQPDFKERWNKIFSIIEEQKKN